MTTQTAAPCSCVQHASTLCQTARLLWLISTDSHKDTAAKDAAWAAYENHRSLAELRRNMAEPVTHIRSDGLTCEHCGRYITPDGRPTYSTDDATTPRNARPLAELTRDGWPICDRCAPKRPQSGTLTTYPDGSTRAVVWVPATPTVRGHYALAE